MALAERFRAMVSEAFASAGTTADLLPMVFAQAAVSVLPIDGAGLSITGHLRIPLAATDQHVVTAEQLQTTLGEGPCLTAVSSGRPIVADLDTMAVRWPTFHQELSSQTPYQSVASFPLLSSAGSLTGAMDLYSISPDTFGRRELDEIDAAVAVPITAVLFQQSVTDELDWLGMPTWLTQDSVDERMNVWVAVGMSMQRLSMSNSDALALLRGYAYSHSLTLDHVARLVTNLGLEPEELLV
jgi:hypothetical protein